jgi:hypothetical protein
MIGIDQLRVLCDLYDGTSRTSDVLYNYRG